MKRFDSRCAGIVSILLALAMVALALVAFVVVAVVSLVFAANGGPSSFLKALSGGKSIHVVIYEKGDRVDRQIPALDGASAGFSGGYGYSMPGQSVHVQSDEIYKVVASGSGHFKVMLHRIVEENGAKTITDSTLPVWAGEPQADKRIRLPDGSSAVAYLTQETSH